MPEREPLSGEAPSLCKRKGGTMNWINHHGIEALAIYWFFSAFTGGMPTPPDDAGIAYRWAFSSFSLLNGSVARFIATQMPSSKVGQALTGTPPVSPVVVAKPEAIEPTSKAGGA